MADVDTQILVAGAGPTGLVLALSLARQGVRCRIVSEAAGPGEHSRAMGVHARTLEFYRQFGFAEEVIEAGVPTRSIHLREAARDGAGREVLSISLDGIGEGISPYPFMLTYPQDDHEHLLLGKLTALGVEVEWNTRLAGFTQDAEGVTATLTGKDGQAREIRAAWLCGCDGAHSQVRKSTGVAFDGGDYEQLFYVADVKLEGPFQRDMWVNLGKRLLALLMPVRSRGVQRLLGLVPPEFAGRRDVTFEDIRAREEALAGVRVAEVNWFSTYHVHHRVAQRFAFGRVFLAGDAAHIHSPAGGQGMNTGIGDAINLAWKLARVARGLAPPALLESYEPERIGFARSLVATTDRAFTPMVAGGVPGTLMRRLIGPATAWVATHLGPARRRAFRMLSQTHIQYRESPLSAGRAGGVRGGDRLPWAQGAPDNYAPLGSLDWQVHSYGTAPASLDAACRALGLPHHAFPWEPGPRRAGIARDSVFLVRPDGYIALAAPAEAAAAALAAYARRHGLRLGRQEIAAAPGGGAASAAQVGD